MQMRDRFSHRPPHWWPEDAPWPPRRRLRHFPFSRRFGCLFPLINLMATIVFFTILLLVARRVGLLYFSIDLLQWVVPAGILVLMFVVLAITLSALGMRRVFAPFDELLSAADRLAGGDYAVHVEERGSREVRTLVRAFNKMAGRLQQTDEQRRQLLADVTHELRNPLTVIQGNLEGMLDGIYPAEEAGLRSLLEETNILSRLVEDLRTLALAESGALQLHREPADVGLLVGEVLGTFRTQAEAAGITLRAEGEKDLPAVDLDQGRIRQVLTNLIVNALRYTARGGEIRISCHVEREHLILKVQDSGRGIPPEDLPHVFERFYKSADSGGMGLGLAIAKQLIEIHGGTLQAESAPGMGTSMNISLPL